MRVVLRILLTCVSACMLGAPAAAQSLDLTQYAHTIVRPVDWNRGFGTSTFVTVFAQTPDGYVWCGTTRGLFRFDGVSFTRWQPPDGPMPDDYVTALTVTRDGTLWVGTRKGLVSWKNGHVKRYGDPTTLISSNVLERADGTIWFSVRPHTLCTIRSEALSCFPRDTVNDDLPFLTEDRNGVVWAFGYSAIWRVAPGSPRAYPLPGNVRLQSAFAGVDRSLVIVGRDDRLWRIVGETVEQDAVPGFELAQSFTPSAETPQEVHLFGGYMTRDGALWLASTNQGLLHVHDGRTDRFGIADGLSDNSILQVFEDHEGNVWVSTQQGLDRFRPVAVRTISPQQGLSSSTVWAVQATASGDVWIGTAAGLNRVPAGTMNVMTTSLRGPVYSLGLDANGQLLASTAAGLVIERGGSFQRLGTTPARPVVAIATDADRNIWMSTAHGQLLHQASADSFEQVPIQIPSVTPAPDRDHIRIVLPDRGGNLWLGFSQLGIAQLSGTHATPMYAPGNHLMGLVTHMRFGSDGALWSSMRLGVARVKDGLTTVLAKKNGLPCGSAEWTMEDDDHTLWIGQYCGIVRIDRAEWEAWVKDDKRPVQLAVFESDDGVRSVGREPALSPAVTRSADGRIWSVVTNGVSVFNPRDLPVKLPPLQPQIEQITADGRTEELFRAAPSRLRLGPSLRNLEIDFTAPAFTAPEKIRFRFKLDGQDPDWREVVNQRQVTYSNLAPGPYRFHVMAANAGGAWSPENAMFEFDVAPAFYQRRTFVAAMATLGVLLVGLIYRLRVRQISRRLSRRFDERLDERTRVAREIHDTFLQTVQGSKLVADHALKNRADHDGVVRAVEQLSEWLKRATDEARSALNSLRASTTATNDLDEAFRRAADECRGASHADISLSVQGDARGMHPVVHDEVYRIGYEAIRNACTHSTGNQIAISLEYGHDVTLRVSDNGAGIDPVILATGKDGHFGLRGMTERAERIQARLTIVSAPESGTTITLVVPGRVAFRSVQAVGHDTGKEAR